MKAGPMFKALMARSAARAEASAAVQTRRLAERLEQDLPADVRAEADVPGVRLTGRALKRRMALDPALRWIMAELIR